MEQRKVFVFAGVCITMLPALCGGAKAAQREIQNSPQRRAVPIESHDYRPFGPLAYRRSLCLHGVREIDGERVHQPGDNPRTSLE